MKQFITVTIHCPRCGTKKDIQLELEREYVYESKYLGKDTKCQCCKCSLSVKCCADDPNQIVEVVSNDFSSAPQSVVKGSKFKCGDLVQIQSGEHCGRIGEIGEGKATFQDGTVSYFVTAEGVNNYFSEDSLRLTK